MAGLNVEFTEAEIAAEVRRGTAMIVEMLGAADEELSALCACLSVQPGSLP